MAFAEVEVESVDFPEQFVALQQPSLGTAQRSFQGCRPRQEMEVAGSFAKRSSRTAERGLCFGELVVDSIGITQLGPSSALQIEEVSRLLLFWPQALGRLYGVIGKPSHPWGINESELKAALQESLHQRLALEVLHLPERRRIIGLRLCPQDVEAPGEGLLIRFPAVILVVGYCEDLIAEGPNPARLPTPLFSRLLQEAVRRMLDKPPAAKSAARLEMPADSVLLGGLETVGEEPFELLLGEVRPHGGRIANGHFLLRPTRTGDETVAGGGSGSRRFR